MSRDLTPRELHIKEVTRELLEAVGGVDACEAIAGKSKSMYSLFQRPNSDSFITVADVMKLEPVTRNGAKFPLITRMLCQNAGGVFVPLPDVDAGDDDLSLMLLEITDELGQVARTLRDAMADGECDSKEATGLRKQISELLMTATSFDQRLAEIEAKK